MRNDFITPISENRNLTIVLIAKIRWFLGERKTETLSLILDISTSEVEEISRSSEYLNAVKRLIISRKKGIELKNWLADWTLDKERFAKRMGTDVSVAHRLFQEIERELDSNA